MAADKGGGGGIPGWAKTLLIGSIVLFFSWNLVFGPILAKLGIIPSFVPFESLRAGGRPYGQGGMYRGGAYGGGFSPNNGGGTIGQATGNRCDPSNPAPYPCSSSPSGMCVCQ
jgi:hypothetical protein